MSTNGAKAGWASNAAGTRTATVPPRATTRAISWSDLGRSGKNISAICDRALSKVSSGEGESVCVALVELDVWPDAAGNGQHRLVEVDPDDGAVGFDEVGGGAAEDRFGASAS